MRERLPSFPSVPASPFNSVGLMTSRITVCWFSVVIVQLLNGLRGFLIVNEPLRV